MLNQIILVFAFVFFVLAGLRIPEPPRFAWLGWGLAFFILSMLVPKL